MQPQQQQYFAPPPGQPPVQQQMYSQQPLQYQQQPPQQMQQQQQQQYQQQPQQQQPFTASAAYYPSQQQQPPQQQWAQPQQPGVFQHPQPQHQMAPQQPNYPGQSHSSVNGSEQNQGMHSPQQGRGGAAPMQQQNHEIIQITGSTHEDPGIEVHVRARRSACGSTPGNSSWSDRGAVDGSGSLHSSMNSSCSEDGRDLQHIQPTAPKMIGAYQQDPEMQQQQQQPMMTGPPPQGLPSVPKLPEHVQQHHVSLPPVPQHQPQMYPQQQQQQQPQMYQQPPPGQMYQPRQVQQMGLVGGPGGGGAPVQLGMPPPPLLQQPGQPPPPAQPPQQPGQLPPPPSQPNVNISLAHPQPGQDPSAFAVNLLSRLREETQDANLELMVNNLTHEQLQALITYLNANGTTILHLCEKERGKVLTQVLARTHGLRCDEMVKTLCSNLGFLATHRVGCVAITRTVKALTGIADTKPGRNGALAPVPVPQVIKTPQQEASSQLCLDMITQSAMRLLPELAKHDHGNFVCSSVLSKAAAETAFFQAWSTFKIRPDFFVECAISKSGSHVIDAFVCNSPKIVLEEVIQFVFMPRPDFLSQMASSSIANYPLQGLIRTLRTKLVQAGTASFVPGGLESTGSVYNSPQWVWLQENIPKYCLSSQHYTNILVALTGEGSGPMRRRKDHTTG